MATTSDHRTGPRTGRAIAVIAAFAALSAACADGSDGSVRSSGSNPPSDEPDTTESSDAPAPSSTRPTSPPPTEPVEDVIPVLVETWNPSTEPIWDRFEKQYEGLPVDIAFVPVESSAFDEEIRARLDAGTAGDIIGCRPHDRSRTLYNAGHLADLSDMETPRLGDFAYSAWTADDGARYCIPVSSVAFGFLYNADIFDELALSAPTTIDEFEDVLAAVESDGRYVPLALGTENQSRVGSFLLSNLGPAFWGGEAGRTALATGDLQVADTGLPDLFELVARWGDYLPDAHDLVDPILSNELFVGGNAAIVPVGSWVVGQFEDVEFEIGSFPAPGRTADDPCVVVSPQDLAFGMNPATEHPEIVRDFLAYVASEDFGIAFSETIKGQYSLQRPIPPTDDPLSIEVIGWIDGCEAALPFSLTGYGDNSREVLETTWEIATGLAQGTLTPAEAVDSLQTTIDTSREP